MLALPPTLAARPQGTGPRGRARGFTFVELALALVVAALLAAVALPSYQAYLNRAKVRQAVGEIKAMELRIEAVLTQTGSLPATLDAIAPPADPWGNAYRYLPVAGASVGQLRKDRSLHPINTDYDLYSMGADGRTVTPLTARASQDDVVRGRNGAFVGLGADF